jgi:MFS family permease
MQYWRLHASGERSEVNFGYYANAIFTNPWVRAAAVPLALLLIGVLARRLGRRDGDPSPRANDWAIATTLLLMALGTILGDLFDATQPAAQVVLLYWLIGVLAAAFTSLNHDRYASWIRDPATGLPTQDKHPIYGIVLPDVLCFGIFAAYQAHKVGLL